MQNLKFLSLEPSLRTLLLGNILVRLLLFHLLSFRILNVLLLFPPICSIVIKFFIYQGFVEDFGGIP